LRENKPIISPRCVAAAQRRYQIKMNTWAGWFCHPAYAFTAKEGTKIASFLVVISC
jgi:hypothetical protein